MSNIKTCKKCCTALFSDDISIHRKLIFKGADDFFCITCLSEYFGCEKIDILNLIEFYRNSGECTLFR